MREVWTAVTGAVLATAIIGCATASWRLMLARRQIAELSRERDKLQAENEALTAELKRRKGHSIGSFSV